MKGIYLWSLNILYWVRSCTKGKNFKNERQVNKCIFIFYVSQFFDFQRSFAILNCLAAYLGIRIGIFNGFL